MKAAVLPTITTQVCICCRKNPCTCNVIALPVHPDEKDIPVSVIYFPISGGRYVRITGPLAYHSLDMLEKTLIACKPALVAEPVEDYQI